MDKKIITYFSPFYFDFLKYSIGILQVLMFSISEVQDIEKVKWLSDGVLDLRQRRCWFESHWRQCIVSLS